MVKPREVVANDVEADDRFSLAPIPMAKVLIDFRRAQ